MEDGSSRGSAMGAVKKLLTSAAPLSRISRERQEAWLASARQQTRDWVLADYTEEPEMVRPPGVEEMRHRCRRRRTAHRARLATAQAADASDGREIGQNRLRGGFRAALQRHMRLHPLPRPPPRPVPSPAATPSRGDTDPRSGIDDGLPAGRALLGLLEAVGRPEEELQRHAAQAQTQAEEAAAAAAADTERQVQCAFRVLDGRCSWRVLAPPRRVSVSPPGGWGLGASDSPSTRPVAEGEDGTSREASGGGGGGGEGGASESEGGSTATSPTQGSLPQPPPLVLQTEAAVAGTRRLRHFDTFLERLQAPEAQPLMRRLREFVSGFQPTRPAYLGGGSGSGGRGTPREAADPASASAPGSPSVAGGQSGSGSPSASPPASPTARSRGGSHAHGSPRWLAPLGRRASDRAASTPPPPPPSSLASPLVQGDGALPAYLRGNASAPAAARASGCPFGREARQLREEVLLSGGAAEADEEATQEDGRRVRLFLRTLRAQALECAAWRDAGYEECEELGEHLERFLTAKLAPSTVAARPGERARDTRLRRTLAAFAFLRPRHLDLPGDGAEWAPEWEAAAAALRALSRHAAPRDKMTCVLNACKRLASLLRAASEGDAPPGADDFLPAIILTVARANPPGLLSHLAHVAAFRDPDKLVSEPGYFLMSVTGAASFFETADATSFTVEPSAFARRYARLAARWDRGEAEGPLPPPGRRSAHASPRDAGAGAAAAGLRGSRVRAGGKGAASLPPPVRLTDVENSSEDEEAEAAWRWAGSHGDSPMSLDWGASGGVEEDSGRSEGQAEQDDAYSDEGPGDRCTDDATARGRGPSDRALPPWPQVGAPPAWEAPRVRSLAREAVALADSPTGQTADDLGAWLALRCRFRHLAPGDVRAADAPELLQEYRVLAETVDALLRERYRGAT